jgi:hypothetical protein
MSPLCGDPQQRRQLLPQLWVHDAPPRRPPNCSPSTDECPRPGRRISPGAGVDARAGSCTYSGLGADATTGALTSSFTGTCKRGGRAHRNHRSSSAGLVSTATSQPPRNSQPPAGGISTTPSVPPPAGDACPLCGAPLHPEQAWCLNCGAAARTRLAASPSWKGPIGVFAAVLALALGVLAAALIDLAGGSAPVPAITRTVTTAPAAITPSTSSTATTTAPGSLLPGAGSSTTSTSATGTAGATATPTTATPSATPTSTTPGLSTKPAPPIGAKTKNEISKAAREGLRKAGVGKLLPGTAGPG